VGIKIVRISSDPPDALAKMKGELHLLFPLLSDGDEQVIQRYGLMHQQGKREANIAHPAVLLLDREGVIRWAMFTDNVRVRVRPEALLRLSSIHSRNSTMGPSVLKQPETPPSAASSRNAARSRTSRTWVGR